MKFIKRSDKPTQTFIHSLLDIVDGVIGIASLGFLRGLFSFEYACRKMKMK